MQKWLEQLMDDNYRKWHLFSLSIVMIILSSYVVEHSAIIGLAILFLGLFIMRAFFSYTASTQIANNLSSNLSSYIPDDWNYSIKGNIITIVRSDKQFFRIAKDYSDKNSDVDFIWKERLMNRNLVLDVLNRDKSQSRPGLLKTLFRDNQRQNEFVGNAEELVVYITSLD
jgi:hypothetical protein